MTVITDLLIIDHLISAFVTLPYLPLVLRHLSSFYFYLKFEQVQYSTHCCVLNSCLLNIIYERVIGKIKIKSSAITNRLSVTMAGLIIDSLFSSD